MFLPSRHLLFVLAATASAAPQYYPVSPYLQQPVLYGHPISYGHHAYGLPYAYAPSVMPYAQSRTNTLFGGLESFGDITTTNSVCGGTVAGTAGTAACTVTGRAEFSSGGIKDLICQGNAGLTLNLQGSGVKANNKYTIYVASDVALTAATASKVVEFTAPIVGPGGVNLYFCADGFNVDGSNSKTAVKAKYVVVQDTTSTATTVGATEAVLP